MFKKLSFIFALVFFNFIFCNSEFPTMWGQCTLKNDEISIKNNELQKIIINKIEKLNQLYGPIKKKQFSIIIWNRIINNSRMQVVNETGSGSRW